MTHKTNDRVKGTLKNAPRGRRGFGFVTPDDGSPDIFVTEDAILTAGLSYEDIGCPVIVTMQESHNGRPAFGAVILRDDVLPLVDGEEPDAIEAEILHRLLKIERMVARLLIRREEGV